MLETICDILVDAYKRNWITSRDGNISIRHHERDHFYITPSGVRKQTLQPDQFKKIGIKGEIWYELPYTDISKNLTPSGEIPLHFGLQRAMGQHADDVRVIVHLHPTYCVAAMHAGIELNELVKSFPELSRYTNVGKNVGDVPPISQQLADPFGVIPLLGRRLWAEVLHFSSCQIEPEARLSVVAPVGGVGPMHS